MGEILLLGGMANAIAPRLVRTLVLCVFSLSFEDGLAVQAPLRNPKHFERKSNKLRVEHQKHHQLCLRDISSSTRIGSTTQGSISSGPSITQADSTLSSSVLDAKTSSSLSSSSSSSSSASFSSSSSTITPRVSSTTLDVNHTTASSSSTSRTTVPSSSEPGVERRMDFLWWPLLLIPVGGAVAIAFVAGICS